MRTTHWLWTATLLASACAAPAGPDARFLSGTPKSNESEIGDRTRADMLVRLARPEDQCAADHLSWDTALDSCAYLPATSPDGIPFVLAQVTFPELWAGLDGDERTLAEGEIGARAEALAFPLVLLVNPESMALAGTLLVGAYYWVLHVDRQTLGWDRNDNFMNSDIHSDAERPTLRLVQNEVKEATRETTEEERRCWESMAEFSEAELSNGRIVERDGLTVTQYLVFVCDSGQGLHHRPAVLRWAPRIDTRGVFTFVNTAQSYSTVEIKTGAGRMLVPALEAPGTKRIDPALHPDGPWNPTIDSSIRIAPHFLPNEAVRIPIVPLGAVR